MFFFAMINNRMLPLATANIRFFARFAQNKFVKVTLVFFFHWIPIGCGGTTNMGVCSFCSFHRIFFEVSQKKRSFANTQTITIWT